MGLLKYAVAGALKGGADTYIDLRKEERAAEQRAIEAEREQSIWEKRQQRLDEIERERHTERTAEEQSIWEKRQQRLAEIEREKDKRKQEAEIESYRKKKEIDLSFKEAEGDGDSLGGEYHGYKSRAEFDRVLSSLARSSVGYSDNVGFNTEEDKKKYTEIVRAAKKKYLDRVGSGDANYTLADAVSEIAGSKEDELAGRAAGESIQRYAKKRAKSYLAEKTGIIDKALGVVGIGDNDAPDPAVVEEAYRRKAIEARAEAKRLIESRRGDGEFRARVLSKLRAEGIPTDGL